MTITTVTKSVEFDAGHRVPDHRSKCQHPHGHRYRVQATVTGPVVDAAGRPDNGMVVDFGDLKRWLQEDVHDLFDHASIIYTGDTPYRDAMGVFPTHPVGARACTERGWHVVLVDWVPTAENMAHAIHRTLQTRVTWPGCFLSSVTVWETPTSSAEVTG